MKAPRLIRNLTKTTTLHTRYIDASQFFVLVMIVAHNLGCYFFMIPALFRDCVPAAYNELEVNIMSKDFLTAGGAASGIHNGEVGELLLEHGSPECDGQCGICESSPDSIGIIPGSWRDVYEVEQKVHLDQYVDALYWSLTTMTTIGYGDRSPHLKCEIVYTMIAEVLGLSFFAMLLNEITILQEVAGRQMDFANEEKNTVVSFMKHNDLDNMLIQEVVAFLNFKAKGHSGRALKESDEWKPGMEHFRELSPPLKQRIKKEIFVRPLREVRIFGHSRQEAKESTEMREMFDDIDEDGGGSLDQVHVKPRFRHLLVDSWTDLR